MPTSTPEFNINIVSAKEAAKILKESRRRGSRSSKYSPVYEAISELDTGKFVILRSVDKSAKLSLYQGIKRNFDADVRMASARDRDASGEAYTIVIGKSADHAKLKQLAKDG